MSFSSNEILILNNQYPKIEVLLNLIMRENGILQIYIDTISKACVSNISSSVLASVNGGFNAQLRHKQKVHFTITSPRISSKVSLIFFLNKINSTNNILDLIKTRNLV